jgi:hypothetical protein
MPTLKTKMSASAWVLIALVVIAAISLPLLHVFGIIDLSFLGEGFMNIMAWGSAEVLNGALLLGGVFIGGALTWYTLKKYIIGTQIPTTTYQTQNLGYNPQPTQPSQPQQEEETVIT